MPSSGAADDTPIEVAADLANGSDENNGTDSRARNVFGIGEPKIEWHLSVMSPAEQVSYFVTSQPSEIDASRIGVAAEPVSKLTFAGGERLGVRRLAAAFLRCTLVQRFRHRRFVWISASPSFLP